MKKYILLLFLFFLCLTAPADQLVLKDGRVIGGCRVEKKNQELFAVFPHGKLKILSSQIQEIIYDKQEEYKPRDEFDRKQLAKGFVFFEGVWRTKRKRDSILEERKKKEEARLKELVRRMDWEYAWKKETPHFLFITNTSENLLRYYSSLFEQFYKQFIKQWGMNAVKGGVTKKPTIEIYRNQREYLAAGGPKSSLGVFYYLSEELKLYHDSSDPRTTLDILFHEGTHLAVHLLRSEYICPVWVNEGLAEYYGASTLDEKGRIQCGQVQEGRLAVLRTALSEGKYVPLGKLFLTPQKSFGAIHYAEAWCLIHFLHEHKKYRSRFLTFFSSLIQGSGVRETVVSMGKGRNIHILDLKSTLSLFQKKMGLPDLKDLEKEFIEYITYGLPDVGARGYLASARTRFRNNDFTNAMEDLKTAIEMGANDPACYVICGRIYSLWGEHEKAAVHYLRALELEPLNPDFHLELGYALRSSEDPLMMDEGIRRHYLATEIAPDHPGYLKALNDALSGQDLIMLREVKKRFSEIEEPKRKSRE